MLARPFRMPEISKVEALERMAKAEDSADRYRNRVRNLESASEFQMDNLVRGLAETSADFVGAAFSGWVTADRKIWKTKIPVSTVPASIALVLDLVGWSTEYITVGALSRLMAMPIKGDFVLWNYKKRLAWQIKQAAEKLGTGNGEEPAGG